MASTLAPAETRYQVMRQCQHHVALLQLQPVTGRRCVWSRGIWEWR